VINSYLRNYEHIVNIWTFGVHYNCISSSLPWERH
jgi:hypothetical protein